MTPKKRTARKPVRVPDFDVRSKAVPVALFGEEQRIRFSPGGGSVREAEARIRELRKLVTWRAWDVLHAIKQGSLDAGNVAAAMKAEGEAALAPLRREIARQGSAAAEPAPTLREMAESYLAQYAGGGRREEHSVKQVRSRLLGPRAGFCGRMVDYQGETVEIGSLPFPLLESQPDLLEAVIQKGWQASATREAIRLAVSGLYSWAIERERRDARAAGRPARWSENPARLIEQYERRPRVVTASEAQVRALLAHAELHQLTYVRAFVHMGFREDELIHTRLHLDLDPDSWRWHVQGRGPDSRHGCIQCRGKGWTPKAKRSWRTLAVPPQPEGLRRTLLDYLDAYPVDAGDFLFRNPRTGQAWDAGALQDDFRALCTRAGVTYGRKVPGGITLHDLRATCATRLVQAKERESVIAALLGDTVETIVRPYVRLPAEDTARAVANGPAYEVERGEEL